MPFVQSWKIPWVFQGQDKTQIEPLNQQSRHIFSTSLQQMEIDIIILVILIIMANTYRSPIMCQVLF